MGGEAGAATGAGAGVTAAGAAAGAGAATGSGLGITIGLVMVTGFGIATSRGKVGAGAGFFAATIGFAFALAFIVFLGAARLATFLAALRTTRAFFFTERFLLERDADARIFAFAFGRFFDFLFLAMVRLLLTELFNTGVLRVAPNKSAVI